MLWDGFGVMVDPALFIAEIVGVGAFVVVLRAVLGGRREDVVPEHRIAMTTPRPPRRAASDDIRIVSAYNTAVLGGWPPGEQMTFDQVSRVLAVEPEVVRAVIASCWRR